MTSSTTISTANTMALASVVEMYALASASMMPRSSPPRNAPGMEPMPPNTAAVNALMPGMEPVVGMSDVLNEQSSTPVCAMMCAFGTDIIRVIFEGGSFTAASTEMTGSIFARYALGMSAFAVLDLLNKAYYAMKKTLVPLLINLGVLALNIVLNRVFRTDTGVAAATSIALTIGALAMIAQLFRGTGIVRLMPLLKGLAATAAMSLVLYGGHALLVTADESKLMLVVKCGLTGVAGCAVYLGVSLLLRQTIMAETIRKFKK